MPSNLTVLRRNLELNGVNATVFPGAIDAGDGHLFMEVEHMDYGHRVADLARAPANNKVEVTAYSIPTLVRRLGWERIGLLKVDIEGHEKVLLSGDAGWAHLVDAMCVECHEGFGERDLEDFARRFGFRPPKRLPGIWLLER
jgi:FkbM family methyltransferase